MTDIISEDKNLYHGTSIENKDEILKNRKFNLSSGASEWAGSGIYFFIDEDDNIAESNARKWAEYIKNIKNPYIAVVIVNLKVIDAVVLEAAPPVSILPAALDKFALKLPPGQENGIIFLAGIDARRDLIP